MMVIAHFHARLLLRILIGYGSPSGKYNACNIREEMIPVIPGSAILEDTGKPHFNPGSIFHEMAGKVACFGVIMMIFLLSTSTFSLMMALDHERTHFLALRYDMLILAVCIFFIWVRTWLIV